MDLKLPKVKLIFKSYKETSSNFKAKLNRRNGGVSPGL